MNPNNGGGVAHRLYYRDGKGGPVCLGYVLIIDFERR